MIRCFQKNAQAQMIHSLEKCQSERDRKEATKKAAGGGGGGGRVK